MTPIDVVKTRIQIDPAYKKMNILTGTRQVIANEGPRGLLTGFGPSTYIQCLQTCLYMFLISFSAAVGYLVQGGAKFAGYEYWKKQFISLTGSQEEAVKYRTAIYLGASSVAE
jgi:solute carrier family 25 (mitochondrial phosphate transporter), member 3